MTNITEKIDWITLSKKPSYDWDKQGSIEFGNALEVARDAYHELTGLYPTFKTVRGGGFYQVAFEVVPCGVKIEVSERLKTQGIKVTFSGETLRQTIPAETILRNAFAAGYKVTRLDIAVDIVDGEYTVSDYISEVTASLRENKQKTLGVITGAKGDTLYVGSRKSAKMLRIYDKGLEQGLRMPWIRLEAELKDYAAQPAAEQWLFDRRFAFRLVTELSAIPDSPLNQPLRELSYDAAYEPIKAPQTKPDRLKWFEGQVTAALENLMLDDPLAAVQAFATLEEMMITAYEKWMQQSEEGKNPENWYNMES